VDSLQGMLAICYVDEDNMLRAQQIALGLRKDILALDMAENRTISMS
jgi:hypothetical protein